MFTADIAAIALYPVHLLLSADADAVTVAAAVAYKNCFLCLPANAALCDVPGRCCRGGPGGVLLTLALLLLLLLLLLMVGKIAVAGLPPITCCPVMLLLLLL